MYNSITRTTGKTPGELFFHRQFRDNLPLVKDINYNQYHEEEMRDREKEKKRENE